MVWPLKKHNSAGTAGEFHGWRFYRRWLSLLWVLWMIVTKTLSEPNPSWIVTYRCNNMRRALRLVLVWVSVLIVTANECLNRIDHDIEIIPVDRSQTQTVSRECSCNITSTNCSWSRFTDQETILNSGIITSLLMWHIEIGYGQYSCIDDHSLIVKSVLILPESKENTVLVHF